MYQQFAFTFSGGLDIKNIPDLQIHNGFILALPFRLRTGILFSMHIGDSFDVIFRNRLDIPCGTLPDEIRGLMWEGKKLRPREQFFTEVLVIDKNNAAVSKDSLEQFIAYIESVEDQKMPDSTERVFEAFTALNDAIVCYHHATNSLFGGTVVERLTMPIFFERLRFIHKIICPSGYELSQAELVEILDARSERQFTEVGGQFQTSQLDDAPTEQLALIQQYTMRHQQFLFYQFALDAKSKMVEQDFVTAILFAVIALEGVLFALLQICLDRRLTASITDDIDRASQVERTANLMLKDVGLSESLKIIPLLFLDDKDRPSEGEIKNCQLGVSIRNEIMHASVKKGQYKLRNRTNKQITEAYSSVLKVFDLFVKIVERDNEADT